VRVVLLVASATCFFIAMVMVGRWGWLGIDPDTRLSLVWGYAAGMWLALSFLPWKTKLRFWFDQP
jgi:hypothetical protein